MTFLTFSEYKGKNTGIEGERFPHRWYKEYNSDIVPHNGDFFRIQSGRVMNTIWLRRLLFIMN